MNLIIKKITSAIILASFLIIPTTGLLAQTTQVPEITDFMGIIQDLVDWVFGFLLIVAVLFLLFAAFTYITASGEPEKIKKANQSIMWALIGVAVGLLSKGLVIFVGTLLGQTLTIQ